MPHLFHQLAWLERHLGAQPTWLCALDFDGTLAPIMGDRDQVALTARRRHLLRLLARQPGVEVAVLSGRSLPDLRTRVAIDEIHLAGNHGLEMRGPGWSFCERLSLARLPTLAELCDDLTRRLAHLPGVEVENKGLTASVHYRAANPADRDAAVALIEQLAPGGGELFRAKAQRAAHEIRPSIDWHKGKAVLWMMERFG